MRIARRRKRSPGLLSFSGWFLVSFIALLAIWGYITPVYNHMVAAAASPLFNLVEQENVSVVHADGSRLSVGRRSDDGTIQPFLYFDPYIYFGIIPLIALLISVPGAGILSRLRRTSIGIVILFVVHVIYLIGSIELTYVAVGLHTVGPTSKRLLDWAQILLRILWQVSPVLIAVMLSIGFWRDHLLAIRHATGNSTQSKFTPTEGVEGERP